MHRSGTSMVSAALDSAGVYGGALRDHNAEPMYAIDINDRLLQKAGGSWWQLPKVEDLDRVCVETKAELTPQSLYAAHFKHPTGNTLRQKMHWNGPWQIKDPRMSLTLPWWLARFPKARIIWVQRDENAVVRSLLNRQEKSDEAHSALSPVDALNLVRSYNERISSVVKSEGVDFRVVHYEELTHEDPAVQRKIWHSLYAFAGVKPGQMEGFTARSAMAEHQAPKSLEVFPTEGPLVSVLVPNYNHEPYLDERIRSIVEQTYTHTEIILMDDCSTDDSRTVLEQWAQRDSRITLLFNEENSGSPFAQWAKGAAQAKGKYLWIAESDDACALDMLAAHVHALEQTPTAVVAYSHSHLVDEQGALLRDFLEDYAFIFGDAGHWKSDFVAHGPTEVATYMTFSNTIPNASGALFNMEAFRSVGAPETSWRLNGDWLFYSRLLQKGDVVFLSQPRNKFRFHAQTQRSRTTASYKAFDEILAMYEVYERESWTGEQTLKAARAQVAMWWAGNLFDMANSWDNWKNNWRLYNVFRPYRSALGWFIVRSFILHYSAAFIKAIGLKEPVKKWAAKLFPKTFFAH